jgi:hypothetical protein
MGFMAVVAFCFVAATEDQPANPSPACIWVENEYVFETETACAITANRLRQDPIIRINVERSWLAEGVDLTQGQVAWFTYCPDPDKLKEFYRSFGFPNEYLDDIPDKA